MGNFVKEMKVQVNEVVDFMCCPCTSSADLYSWGQVLVPPYTDHDCG